MVVVVAGGGSHVLWFVGDGEGRSSPWLVVGHSLLSVHGQLWLFVCQCGHLSWGVVGRSLLSMCGQLWLSKRQHRRSSCAQHAGVRWGTPRHGWGVPWALIVVRIRGGVVVALVMVYTL